MALVQRRRFWTCYNFYNNFFNNGRLYFLPVTQALVSNREFLNSIDGDLVRMSPYLLLESQNEDEMSEMDEKSL